MPITHKQLSIALDDAHLTIARQAEVIAKMREALQACVEEFGDENPDDDWAAIVKARAAIALAEAKP